MKTKLILSGIFILCAIAVIQWREDSRSTYVDLSMKNEKEVRYDKPTEAAKFFYEQRAYPYKEIPEGEYERAMTHVQKMETATLRKSTALWNWIPIGPTNIAGRVKGIVIDPRNTQVVYVAAAGGGVWKSTNDGATWRAQTDYLPNLRLNSIAMHPTNSNVLLAGSGEGWVYWQGGYMFGRGVYRTDDAGENWYLIPSTNAANFDYVFDVTFDQFNPSILYAATNRGIYRSTDDGQTWAKRFPISSQRALQIVPSKTVNGLVYAAMNASGVYKSTDNGFQWTNLTQNGINVPSGYSRVQIAVAPSNSDIVYASFIHNITEACIGMFKTTNGGASWQSVTIPRNEITGDTYVGPQGTFNNAMAVHPTNPNTVYAAGIDIFVTVDGGMKWTRVSNAYTNAPNIPFVHPDHHAIVINPNVHTAMYFGHDGGVSRSVTSGSSFESRNNGLSITQFHSVAPHPTTDQVIGGSQDNGNLVSFSGTQFIDATGADGGYTIIDFQNPAYVYAEGYYLWFRRSTQSGNPGSFRDKMNGIPLALFGDNQWPGTSDRSSFYAPFEIDPNNSEILYAGSYRLYKTTNRADTWSAITGDLTGGGSLTAIAIAKSDSKIIYTGSSDGTVQVTTNGGLNWSNIKSGLPNRWVTDFAIDRNDPGTAYVTFSGFGTGHLWTTKNYGQSWENISGAGATALPDAPTVTVIIYPANSNRIVAGTDVGCFQSFDSGQTWEPITSGMGNVTIADLRLKPDGTLFAATHGRGLFKSSYSLLDAPTLNRPFDFVLRQNYPNPFNPGTFISYQIGTQTPVKIDVHDLSGRVVRELVNHEHQPGNYTIEFDGRGLGSGVYFYRMTAGGRTETKAMVMMK